MDQENRFVKLLAVQSENTYFLLYGFSCPTTQAGFRWRIQKNKKSQQSVLSAILTSDEEMGFIESLKSGVSVVLSSEYVLSTSALAERPLVLHNSHDDNSEGFPISDLCRVREFWNIQKDTLFSCLKLKSGLEGKELYKWVQSLLAWMHQECGVDFYKQSYRFGNFEQYTESVAGYTFGITVDKEIGLKRVAIKKKAPVSGALIVNCAAEHQGRWICNESKVFAPEETELVFCAEEPMSHVKVKIWDAVSGTLVFSKDCSLIMGIHISFEISSATRRVQDPWTQKLFQAASDRRTEIAKIETVDSISRERPIVVNSSTYSLLDQAFEESMSLFAPYWKSKAQGAFIPSIAKDGEIGSFLAVKKYMEDPSVKKVVLADPYFSVESAYKLLARISMTQLRLEIITSLVDIDPDTGQKADICKKCQEFLERNQHILHGNLGVYNLHRGGKQVFHDRYLIRYHEKGSIDGFLLSNSLNSMGRFYPFVIAPMEKEVCLAVCDYLNDLRDAAVQSTRPKDLQVRCDTFIDTAKRTIQPAEVKTTVSPLETWVPQLFSPEAVSPVLKASVPDAVRMIWRHWEKDGELVYRALGDLVGGRALFAPVDDVVSALEDIPGAADAFQQEFPKYAHKCEVRQKQDQKGIYGPAHQLRSMLNGKARPSRQGIHGFFATETGHIFYRDDGGLHGCCRVLFALDADMFISLLEELKSPLMFDAISSKLRFFHWEPTLYVRAASSDLELLHIAAAEGAFVKLNEEEILGGKLLTSIQSLAEEAQCLQLAYIIAQVTFRLRIGKADKGRQEKMRRAEQKMLERLAAAIPACSDEYQRSVLEWLHDCEPVSDCILNLRLAELLQDPQAKRNQLARVESICENELIKVVNEQTIVSLCRIYTSCADQLYGDAAEDMILKKLATGTDLKTATEPVLYHYAYDRWHKAYQLATKKLQLLQIYLEKHPNATKARRWIDDWEARLGDVAPALRNPDD